MALPTFVAAGAFAKSAIGAAITPALPAGIAADDILVLAVRGEAVASAISIANANGGTWTEVTGSPVTDAANRLAVFWSRYNGTQTAPVTSASSNNMSGAIVAVRGCPTTGDPWNVIATALEGISTTYTVPGATTTVANCLVVLISSHSNGTGSATYNPATNADLANLTERVDDSNAASITTALAMWTGEKAAAGAFGATTGDAANAAKADMTIALKPAGGAAPAAHRALLLTGVG